MVEITFSGLCLYLSAKSPAQRRAIARQHKYPHKGPMLSYATAEQRIVSHLVDGAPLRGDNLQSHCREVVAGFARHAWANKLTFERPGLQPEKLQIGNTEISCKASLLVRGPRGERGACKLFCRKPRTRTEPQLEPAVARKMAALLYHYGRDYQEDGQYHPNLCAIWCLRDGDIWMSSARLARSLAELRAACSELELIWPSV